MKIAIVGAIDSPVKKDSLAGTEIWTYNFAESLLGKGHRVTLFASKGSVFSLSNQLKLFCKLLHIHLPFFLL